MRPSNPLPISLCQSAVPAPPFNVFTKLPTANSAAVDLSTIAPNPWSAIS